MGPDVADMAFNQEIEFEMLHRMRVQFRSGEVFRCVGVDYLASKIEVSVERG